MFNDKSTQKFKKDMQSLKIPDKVKVLPPEAFNPNNMVGKKRRPVSTWVLATVVLVLSVLLLTNLNSTGFLDIISPPTNLPTDNNLSDNPNNQKLLVTAEYPNFEKIIKNEGLFQAPYISDMLLSKIEQYKGQDVYFRVLVELITTKDEYNGYQEAKLSAEDEAIIEGLEEQKQSLEEEAQHYENLFAHDLIDSKEQIVEIYDKIKEITRKIEEIIPKINEIKREPYKKYFNQIRNEKLEFAKDVGAQNIKSTTGSSDYPYYDGVFYYMELTEDVIFTLFNRGGYTFYLALPERLLEYNRKISDSLVVLLEQAKDDEEIHVAVVSVLDKSNEFISHRNISCNYEYNSDLNINWQGSEELNNKNVNIYIDAIVTRNNMTDKRIFSEGYSDVFVSNWSNILLAGFEVKLTKDQIVALTNDKDVKAIYLRYSDSDNPPKYQNE